jgi:hypothetical protein
MQRYLDKKAKSREERLVAPVPAKRNASDVPDLELDLSPLATYIKVMIADALKHTQSPPDKSDEELREMIRELVQEEIAFRLKPLFG